MRVALIIAAGLGLTACRNSPAPVASRPSSDGPAAAPSPLDSSVTMTAPDSASPDVAPIPAHLARFPGLSVRQGDKIVPASEADVAVARGYATSADKGAAVDGRRLTILTARTRVKVGEPVRVIHVVETTRKGDELYVMGPKVVLGEHVDGTLRTDPAPATADPLDPTGVYDGAVVPAPAADYNYDVTEYAFDAPGPHTIVWKLGPLASNTLTVEVTP